MLEVRQNAIANSPDGPAEARRGKGKSVGRPEKRRRLRKGTHSCWECKRRKIRCTYASPDDAVCIGCTRRCTECVSQEFPEQTPPPVSQSRLVGDRFVRVEAMVERLSKQAGQLSTPNRSNPRNGNTVHAGVTLTPVSCDTPAPTSASSPRATPAADAEVSASIPVSYIPTPPECSKRDHYADQQAVPTDRDTCRLSADLLAAYPTWHDVQVIINTAGNVAVHFITTTTWDLFEPEVRADTLKVLQTRYTAESHPILITRQMLMLAIVTQFISPEVGQESLGLSEPLPTIRKRLAETAGRLSLMSHEITDSGTLDGLECIAMDGMYQANLGNLRQAWLSWRRAINTAQLMGLGSPHRTAIKTIDPNRKVNASHFWFRLLWVDRYLCLFLGLPQASTDQSMISETNLKDAALACQLERRQCVIAGRIVDRNERGPSDDDSAETRAIDEMLQEAASKMPSKWWLEPNLAAINDEELLLEEISRLMSQMIHYNLLNLLHLPYILHSTLPPASEPDYCTHQYSRITCVNASRDLLKSYIMFRTWNRIACCCRVVDYFALMASMTLLVAHIDSHNTVRERRASAAKGRGSNPHDAGAVNILAHQRMTDRAMMEKALDSMVAVAALNDDDVLNSKSADLLRQLLVIEDEAAQGAQPGAAAAGRKHVLRMDVPHMGSVTIGPNGAFRGEVLAQTQDHSQPLVVYNFPAGTSVEAPQVEGREGVSAPDTGTTLRGEASPSQQSHSAAAAAAWTAVPLRAQQTPVASQSTHVPSSVTATSRSHLAPTLMRASGRAGGLADSGQFMANASSGESHGFNQVVALPPAPSPGLTAGAEQWAFQGVDMTFFNSLMREMDMQPEGEPNGWWPLPDLTNNV